MDEESGMGVMNLPPSVETLVGILRQINDLLTWIVMESGLIRNNFQPLFAALVDDVHSRVEGAIQQLETIDNEEHNLYRELEYYGLTGQSLDLKVAIGRDLSQSVLDSAVESEEADGYVKRILGFSLKRPLKWVNLILGSLAKALPILDAVKEYKEGVELTVDQRQSAPVPDGKIFPGL